MNGITPGGTRTGKTEHGPWYQRNKFFTSNMDSKYQEYLRSVIWKEKRELALQRDHHKCKVCNNDKNLEVHHRTYPAVWGTEGLEDLVTLCGDCHQIYYEQMQVKNRLIRWRVYVEDNENEGKIYHCSRIKIDTDEKIALIEVNGSDEREVVITAGKNLYIEIDEIFEHIMGK